MDESSYSSSDLRVSDLESHYEFDEEPDFDYEDDSLHRHFVEKMQNLDSEIKQLKLNIRHLEHDKEDTNLDLKTEYREICDEIDRITLKKKQKDQEYEFLKQQQETQYKNEEETLRTQYNDNMQNLKATINANKAKTYELKQATSDTKIKYQEKINKLNLAIADLDEKAISYRDEESRLTEKRGALLNQQKQLKALLEKAIEENHQLEETHRKASRKHERIANEVKELEYSAAYF